MKMKYIGESGLRVKYKGRMIHLKKNVTELDIDEKDVKEFSNMKVNGDKQWEAKAPIKEKKGAK